MSINREENLIKKLFLYPIFLIIFAFLLFILSAYFALEIFKTNEINKDINYLINNKKNYVKANVTNLSKNINNALKFTTEATKKDIKNRVYLIHYTMKTIYSLHQNKSFIIKYLNSLNKSLKNHYIFAYDQNGIVKVHILKSFIGKNVKNIYLKNGISVYERNKKILKKENEGFIEKYFFKSNDTTKKYFKINFIKQIPEYNLVIGSGEYVDEMKEKLKNQVFKRVILRRYGNNNYFFILKKDGTFVVNPNYNKNILKSKNINPKHIIKEMIKKALNSKKGDFIEYKWINPNNNKIEKKLTYVLYNKAVDIIIGSGLYIKKDISRYVDNTKKRINNEFNMFYKNLIVIFLIILIISFLLSYTLSKKLKLIFVQYDNLLKEKKNKAEFESLHDSLTKIPNRAFFNQRFQEEFLRAKRYNNNFSIAMIDIDHFKIVNDTYGHDAGDEILKKMTSFIEKNIRETDFIARWGGEEFMVILPNTNSEDANKICEKVKKELQENKFVQTPVKFKISCGITEFRKDDEIEKILKRVDDALYQAKNNGRDKIVVI